MNLFRDLNKTETQEFVDWANDNYVPGEEIKAVWHPVVRERCKQINAAYRSDPGLFDIAIDMSRV